MDCVVELRATGAAACEELLLPLLLLSEAREGCLNGMWKQSWMRFTFLGPTPWQRASSSTEHDAMFFKFWERRGTGDICHRS